jgi:hypothetical protein
MEGVGTKVSRLIAGRTAVALLAAGGVLVGLSACGSDSKESTSAKPSTTGAKKQAGLGVRLDVVNRGRDALAVTICGDGTCRAERPLSPGESTAMAAGSVTGQVAFAGGPGVDFAAENPFIGRPRISLRSPSDSADLQLSEGESRTARLSSFDGQLTGSRASDTDYKMLRLEVAQ